jgi:hypothetical protein
MDTRIIFGAVFVVALVLYLMRRRGRLGKED